VNLDFIRSKEFGLDPEALLLFEAFLAYKAAPVMEYRGYRLYALKRP